MDRLFGTKKKEEKKTEPEPIKVEEPLIDLTVQAQKMDEKCETLYKQIDELDKQISENYAKAKKLKGGQAQSCKQKCINLLQRKKMLEQQVQTYAQSQMTLNSVAFTKENIDNTLETAQAMKQAVKQQKILMEKIDFDDLDNVRDDLEDMMWESKDFNEQMNRNFEVNVNEDDLDAEFDDLEEQFAQEEQQIKYQQNQNIQNPQQNFN